MPKFLQLFYVHFRKCPFITFLGNMQKFKNFTIILLNIIKKHLHNSKEVSTSGFQRYIPFMKNFNITKKVILQ